MDIFDGLKLAFELAKKTQNNDLKDALEKAREKLLELKEENYKLKEEISVLKKIKDIENDIEYYEEPFFTFKSDSQKLKYCRNCWSVSKIVSQLKNLTYWGNPTGTAECPNCKNKVCVDVDVRKKIANENKKILNEMI